MIVLGLLVTIIIVCIMVKNKDFSEYLRYLVASVSFTVICLCCGCLFTQDVGEVVVLKNLGGSLAGSSVDAGFHVKAPW